MERTSAATVVAQNALGETDSESGAWEEYRYPKNTKNLKACTRATQNGRLSGFSVRWFRVLRYATPRFSTG